MIEPTKKHICCECFNTFKQMNIHDAGEFVMVFVDLKRCKYFVLLYEQFPILNPH